MMTAFHDQDAPRTDEVVVALFVDQDTAERAIADLRQAGLREDDIVVADRSEHDPVVDHLNESPARGAAQGVLSGGIVGAVLGVVAALFIPEVGPAVTGGFLGALVAGGALGAVVGGLIGALVAAGGGRVEAGDQAGGTLVTVFTDGRAVKAPTILGLLSKKMERRNLPSFNYFGPDRRADGWA
jgi:hypothetical protein